MSWPTRIINPKCNIKEQPKIKRKNKDLKSYIKVWQNEWDLKTGQENSVQDDIESRRCPEALTWKGLLAGR